MTNTIDMTADDPSDAPIFGGATRVISDNELTGLLAEDARNAPVSIAHRAVIRRSTHSEATTPATPLHDEEPAALAPEQVSAAALEPVPAIIPAAPVARTRIWWLVLSIAVLAAALTAWLAVAR